MSTGGAGADSGRLFKYGSSAAAPNVDLADNQARGTHGGYVSPLPYFSLRSSILV